MKRKIIVSICCLLSVMLFIGGCSNRKTEKETKKDGMYLYYVNTDENAFYPVEYKQGSSEKDTETLKLAKEMIHELSDVSDASTDSYKRAIPESVTINKVSFKDNIVSVDFATSYGQLTPEKEILCRGAIVKTLMQIEGVDGVEITVDSIPLSYNNIAIGVLDEDSFMTSEEDVYSADAQISLYYANESGDKLVEIVQRVRAKDNVPLEQAALELLKKNPSSKPVQSPLPLELQIQKVQIFDNICYVSLSEDIVNSISGVNDEIMIYSMVNTIIGMGNVNSVQFTVDGEKVKTIHEFDKFDQVMTFNYNVCDLQ